MGRLVFTTAIVVIPPQDVWPAIQAIRTKHDTKVRRWMPHITLVCPCLPVADLPAAHEHLAAACHDIPAFEVELAEFRTFRHRRGNHTVWLAPEPESDLIELQAVVQRAAVGEAACVGQPPRFQPHLSVGQVEGNVEMLRLVAELQAAWQPVRFMVPGISLISSDERSDDVFQVAATVARTSPASGCGMATRPRRRHADRLRATV